MKPKEKSNLFSHEENVISEAECYLNDEKLQTEELISQYHKLLKSYKRLLRQSKKLIKISDNQQKNLNEVNNHLQVVSAQTDLAYTELNQVYARMKQDLMFAKRIQQTILPVEMTELGGKKLEFHYQPMAEVGGDIFDVEMVAPERIRIFLADATGHGVQAALITMIIKSEYESLKRLIKYPNELLNTMNQQFMRNFKTLAEFFTCIVADIDLSNNTLYYASAGHPDQYLIGETIVPITAIGKPIGVLENVEYSVENFAFDCHQKLLLFTDGLTEEFNHDEKEFGDEGLIKVLENNREKKMSEIIQSIFSALDQFRDGHSLNDDITVIGVE